MKLSVYSRSLLYAVLVNFGFLLMFKLFFPDFRIFESASIFYFFLINVLFTYFVFVLLYKGVFSQMAKVAYQKSSKRLQEKSIQQTRDKDIQLALLKDREKYRREFLGNVSHELKTPLFTIQSYILTLIDGAVKDKSVRTNYLTRINKSVDRLIYIVRDLDLLAEMESGNFQLELLPVNLEKLIQEVFDFLEIKAKDAKVELHLVSSLSSDDRVMADRERMEQVLTNLVSNAISYSALVNAEVVVRLTSHNETVKVEVEDNGMGISKEHLPRIFERFYRVDAARSREKGGSGLGLAIVKNMLEAHQSEIEIRSKEGEGTVFSFDLRKVPITLQ